MAHRTAILALVSLLLAPGPVAAGPLEDALAQVYLDNPRLAAGRAALRAADETVPMALAGRRPSLTARSDAGIELGGSGGETALPLRQSLSLTQPLYSGGATAASIRQAESLVLAERARLRQVEQQVLLAAVSAFAAVARDQAVLGRARENERRLAAQLAATRDRLRFGALTKTDLAQAEARHAGALAERDQAEGDLATAAAEYLHIVGTAPGLLELPDPPDAPEALDQLLAHAEDSFAYQAARFELEAAEAEIEAARAAFRPRLALNGELAYAEGSSTALDGRSGALLGATLQLPLYQGGRDQARLRQTRELREERASALDAAHRAAEADIAAAYHALATATAQIRSLEIQADAAAFALDGVRQEAQVGARTVLDVLDAEAELFRAEVALLKARAQQTVGAYRLKAATGRLTAEELGLPVETYDPTSHYQMVRNRWFGVGAVGSTR